MAEAPKSTPLLLALIAVLVGYVGYTGDGISILGVEGLKTRVVRASAMKDTLTTLQAKIDTAKRDLAKESLEDIKARVESYRTSLGVLRTLVPEQREVNNLLDDVSLKSKTRGLNISTFVPQPPQPGPAPFDTYSYQFSVIGRYHNIGKFVTDIASLRRIMVSTDLSVTAAQAGTARVLGDTTAVLEAKFVLRTYVKAKSAEDSTHAKK